MQYQWVLPVLDRKQVYEEYKVELSFDPRAAAFGAAVSFTTFSKIFDLWKKNCRISEREKKNVSGKCDGKRLWTYLHL